MIEIQDLAFRYRGNEAYALSGVSLSIPLGAIVGITGPASSGKTTLTRAINGLIPHMFAGDYAGSVKIGEPRGMAGTPGHPKAVLRMATGTPRPRAA